MKRTVLSIGLVVAFALSSATDAHAIRALYSAGPDSDNIAGFKLPNSGELTPLPTSPAAGGDSPGAMTVNQTNTAVFSTSFNTNQVIAHPIGNNGALGALPAKATGDEPGGIALNPTGTKLFVANSADDTVSIYSVNTGTGALTELATSPQPTVVDPFAVAVSPDGQNLYVAQRDNDVGDDTIAAYDVATNGTLTPVAGSPFATGDQPSAIAIRPDGSGLYVLNAVSGTISSYSVAGSGALSELASSPTAAGLDAFGLTLTANGSRLYASSRIGNAIHGFSVGANSALTPLPGSPTASAGGPLGLAASNDGAFLYAASTAANQLRGFAGGANGALTPLNPATFATGVTGAAVGGTIMTPDQGPIAAFNPTTTPTSKTVQFRASGSVDPDGAIVAYHWDFGDGSTKTTTTQNTKHTFASNGKYKATLAVVDDEGCSVFVVFTGQMASCNGSASAVATRTLKLQANSFRPTLKSPSKQSQGGNVVKVKLKAGAGTPVSFVASGKVKSGRQDLPAALGPEERRQRSAQEGDPEGVEGRLAQDHQAPEEGQGQVGEGQAQGQVHQQRRRPRDEEDELEARRPLARLVQPSPPARTRSAIFDDSSR